MPLSIFVSNINSAKKALEKGLLTMIGHGSLILFRIKNPETIISIKIIKEDKQKNNKCKKEKAQKRNIRGDIIW